VRPVSAAFRTTVKASHTMTARARVLTTFQTGTSPTGTTIDIIDGSVVSDSTANIRATIDLTTDGTGMWPGFGGDLLLAPYGNEVFVERGIRLGGETVEWCSLGYFRIQSPSQAAPPNGPIRLTGKDRMAGIIDARLVQPVQFLATDTFGSVMTQLITEVYPSATITWDDSTNTEQVGRSLISQADRYAFLNDLVTSVGKVWYWDHRGFLVIKDPPSSTTPVFDVVAGAGGVLVSMSRTLTRDRVYNAVVASGEGGDTTDPARAVAYNNDPDSPTYYLGRFGPVPQFYTSPFITSATQAQSAANGLLRQQLGLPYSVDFTAVPNPALEPLDPVRIESSADDVTEVHVLQSITVPLTATAALTATTREQTVVLIGEL
jgi:hypothetical protein